MRNSTVKDQIWFGCISQDLQKRIRLVLTCSKLWQSFKNFARSSRFAWTAWSDLRQYKKCKVNKKAPSTERFCRNLVFVYYNSDNLHYLPLVITRFPSVTSGAVGRISWFRCFPRVYSSLSFLAKTDSQRSEKQNTKETRFVWIYQMHTRIF